MSNKLFYRPQTGVCADFIPFYENGTFKLFFLRDYRDRDKHGEGTPWQLTTTTDFISFSKEKEIISRGTEEEQDLYVFTGCVNKIDGLYHIFYTGHNPHLRAKGLPEQAVMHAISKDGENFTKIPEDTFFAPLDRYEMHDWRDPFVYFDEASKTYKMLLATRNKDGFAIRKGCTTMCQSKDLKNWEVESNVLDPQAFFTHECPDYFEIGSWRYIIFSEFSDRCVTRYRMSKDGKTWINPKIDAFDGRAYYAAKSVNNDKNRYLFGWIPTKNNSDHAPWDWGGDLAVHEIYQIANGELRTKMPQSIYESFTKTILDVPHLKLGTVDADMHIDLNYQNKKVYMVECDIEMSEEVTAAGILLNYDAKEDRGYAYTLNMQNKLFVFDIYPNQPWNLSNFVNMNRPIEVKRKYHLQLIVEENISVCYLDNELALSSRVYPLTDNPKSLAILAKNGVIKVTNLKIKTR